MNQLTKYILRDIIYYFLIFLAAMIAIFLVYEIYDTKNEFLENSPAFKDILLFLIFTIPGQLKETMPFICWLAACFSYGMLAKNREILAMAAAGVSFRMLARPALFFGLIMSGVILFFNQVVVPGAQAKSRLIEETIIKGKDIQRLTTSRNIFVKGAGSRFYLIQKYISGDSVMEYPIIFEVNEEGSGIVERIEASRGELHSGGEDDEDVYWVFHDTEQWRFSDSLTLSSYERFEAPYQVKMEQNLSKFLRRPKKMEEMNLPELFEERNLMLQRGSTDVRSVNMTIQKQLAFPFSCLILSLLGFVVVSDIKALKLLKLGTIGLALASGFYFLNVFFGQLAEMGALPAIVAGWAGTLIYAVIVYRLLVRLDHIR